MKSSLPEGWRKVNLEEVVNIIGGGTPKRKELAYWNGDIPWISIKDFIDKEKYIDKTQERISQVLFCV